MVNVRLLPVVAAALIDGDGRVLVQQRPAGAALAGLWEFPGGKIEPGESPEAALARELAEELAITVAECDMAPVGFASERRDDRQLLLLLYLVRRWQGVPRPTAADALAWHHPAALTTLAMPAADVPLIDALMRWLRP